MATAVCSECGLELAQESSPTPEERVACPSCGSTSRTYKKSLAVSETAVPGVRGVAYSESKSKWFAKFSSLSSYWRDGDRWLRRTLHLNKRNDSYTESVVDPETGEIVHHCSEPLSEHRGHGSAKGK